MMTRLTHNLVLSCALLLAAVVIVNLPALADHLDGDLDPTFDGDGKVLVSPIEQPDVSSQGPDYTYDLAQQADGKLVAVGYSVALGSGGYVQQPIVARFNENGSLDDSFGVQGIVTASVTASSLLNTVVVQSDGKLLAGGTAQTSTGNDLALARYTSTGAPDLTFGGDGWITVTVGVSAPADDMLLQPDGKIVVVGWVLTSNAPGAPISALVARFNPDGSPDTGFDGDGIVMMSLGGVNDQLRDVALQPDGKIVAVGFSKPGPKTDLAILRLNTDGSPDMSFDSDGRVTTQFGVDSDDVGNGLALQADGKIVVAGMTRPYPGGLPEYFVTARYLSDGSLDNTFDGDGYILAQVTPGAYNFATDVAFQRDGRIVVLGSTGNLSLLNFGLVRYNTDGSIDNSFGSNGMVSTDFAQSSPTQDNAQALLIQTDGKIVAAGSGSNAPQVMVLARYYGPQFNNRVYLPLLRR